MIKLATDFPSDSVRIDDCGFKYLDVWYQVHSEYIVLADSEHLNKLYAVIRVNPTTHQIVSEQYLNDRMKVMVMRRLMGFSHLERSFNDAAAREIEILQLEYNDGESGELDMHPEFGQMIFCMDDELYL